jgi:hypothetical protein
MALPASGPISGSQIANELGVSATNISLRGMASSASFSSPDSYSEFYGYSNLIPISASWNYAVGSCGGDSFSVYVNSTQVVGPISVATLGYIMVNDNDFIEVYTTSGTKGAGCANPSSFINVYLDNEFYDGVTVSNTGFSSTAYADFTIPNGFSGQTCTVEIGGLIGLVPPA